MDAPVCGIDHIVIAVNDLDASKNAYARLGFTLSSRGVHSAAMGTINHTMMLERDYFEILAVAAPTERNQRWRNMLAHGEGVAGLALAAPDAGLVRDAWARAGLAPSDVVDFQRAVIRDDGTIKARFKTVSLPSTAEIRLEIFACAQLTRQAVWLPELISHPNTASAIGKVTIPVDSPAKVAEACRPVFTGCTISTIDGGLRLITGRHWIDLVHPEAIVRNFNAVTGSQRAVAIGIDFIVQDLGACSSVLSGNGVSAWKGERRLEVSSAYAAGAAIAFTTADALV